MKQGIFKQKNNIDGKLSAISGYRDGLAVKSNFLPLQ